MPRVTLIASNGISRTAYGGCFGFTGRNGSVGGFGDERDLTQGTSVIETFRYLIGDQWNSKSEVGLLNPIPYLKWLCDSSSWAKYIKGYQFPDDRLRSNREAYVDIRTDVPGHCVIGAASALRLASHRYDKLIPFWNLAVNAGADGAIALLVFYALGQYVELDYTINSQGAMVRNKVSTRSMKRPPTTSSGQLSLSDDEVMDLSNVTPGFIYSFIKGEFEMKRNDNSSEALYQDRPRYNQEILNSFIARGTHRNRKNFAEFLLARFFTTLTSSDTHKYSSGMGSSNAVTANRKAPVSMTTLISWSLQLTSEYTQFGRFLGWRC